MVTQSYPILLTLLGDHIHLSQVLYLRNFPESFSFTKYLFSADLLHFTQTHKSDLLKVRQLSGHIKGQIPKSFSKIQEISMHQQHYVAQRQHRIQAVLWIRRLWPRKSPERRFVLFPHFMDENDSSEWRFGLFCWWQSQKWNKAFFVCFTILLLSSVSYAYRFWLGNWWFTNLFIS